MKSLHSFSLKSPQARIDAFLASPVWRDENSADRAVRRLLGLGKAAVFTHAVEIIADGISGPCAECIDAVAKLGVREEAIPSLAETYELLFENADAPGAEAVFPSAPVWGAGGLDRRNATLALDALTTQIGGRWPTPGGLAGHMREEMDALLEMIESSRYFGTVTALAGLGRVQDIRIGDLIRIAFFVAAARMGGLGTTQLNQVRELAVNAIRD